MLPLSLLTNPLSRSVERHLGFPVLPGRFPVLGHFPALTGALYELIREGERRLGPIFWIYITGDQMQLVCTTEEAFTIYRNKVTSSAMFDALSPQLVNGTLITLDGPPHQRLRSALNQPFTPRGLGAGGVGAVAAPHIEERVRAWARRGRIAALAETRELVLDIFFRIIGVEGADVPAWQRHYEELTLDLFPFRFNVPGSPIWRAARARAWLDPRLLELIEQARRDPEAGGLIAQLSRARSDAGEALSSAELVDNLRLLVFAGHETTASVMAWMLFVLAEQPEIFDRLREEACAGAGVPRSPEEMRRFPFAEGLFRETLRLYPPLCVDLRRVTGELTLEGQRIPEGVDITVCLGHLSRSPARYPDPDRLRPERWMDRKEPITPLETVQFGGGPHFCLGYHLAWMEVVQLGVALGRVLGEAGLRPRLAGGVGELVGMAGLGGRAQRAPRGVTFPLLRPPRGARVSFA
jgi:cytochrome P450